MGGGAPSHGWNLFFLGASKNNTIFAFLDDCLTKYFIKHNRIIDYFLIDYFLMIAYNNIDYVKHVIDELEFNNYDVEELVTLLDSPFDSQLYNKLKRSNQFFKLTRKKEFKETVDGKDTFYKKLIME